MALGVDPNFVLDTDLDDLPIVQAVLQRANEMRVEHDEHLAQAIATLTANKTVPGINKNINRLVRALAARG